MELSNRVFDELVVGDSAQLRRLVTQDDLYVFAASSGNYNPLHLMEMTSTGESQASGPVAPGMFVASMISAVLGTQLPGAGAMYLNQTLDFHDRVHAGQELLCRVQVLEKLSQGVVRLSTMVHRLPDEALIVSGEARMLAPQVKIHLKDVDVPAWWCSDIDTLKPS